MFTVPLRLALTHLSSSFISLSGCALACTPSPHPARHIPHPQPFHLPFWCACGILAAFVFLQPGQFFSQVPAWLIPATSSDLCETLSQRLCPPYKVATFPGVPYSDLSFLVALSTVGHRHTVFHFSLLSAEHKLRGRRTLGYLFYLGQ